MNSEIEHQDALTLLTVAYDTIDTTTIRQFKRELTEAIGAKHTLVVDLGRVRFIDSSGLGALLSASRELASAGLDLRLCELTPQVRTLFELVRLHRVFDIANTRAEATDLVEVRP